jgi:Uma2 family endonuclease
MATHSLKVHVPETDYLQAERQNPTKREYLAGEVRALAGASEPHNIIVFNLGGMLYHSLRGKSCRGYVVDMRVKVPELPAYLYPDVVIVCGQPQFEDEQKDNLLNPTVVIEVLSPSTEAFDRGEKFATYQRIPTLREYLLVAQDRTYVEHFIRQPNGQWSCRVYDQPEQSVALLGGTVSLPLQGIYEGISFSQEA